MTKGLLVLLAGFGVLAFIHTDLHLAASQLVQYFHLNPASRYPQIFIDLANHMTDWQLWAFALSAIFYIVARFVEAYGLWHGRTWAKWFGFLTGAAYIPLELFAITRGVTWPKLTLLIVNAGIVAYLSLILYQSKHRREHTEKK